MSNALLLENLSKTYANGVHALKGISLRITPGVFGLLGPNGAGKSTLMRTIATLQEPDTGGIHLGDLDVLKQPAALRQVLGYLPQEFGFYPNLSAEMILDHFASLKGVSAPGLRRDLVDHLLEQVNLAAVRRKRVGGFSGGMKQRLGIAIALIGPPRLIIVDEPTAGLDPTERHRFLNLLADIGSEVIVILSTHIVEDVRELCHEMAIINQGELVLTGKPGDLIEAMRGLIWEQTMSREELAATGNGYAVISTRLVAGTPVVRVHSEVQPGAGFVPVDANLEDVYFHQLLMHGGRLAAGV